MDMCFLKEIEIKLTNYTDKKGKKVIRSYISHCVHFLTTINLQLFSKNNFPLKIGCANCVNETSLQASDITIHNLIFPKRMVYSSFRLGTTKKDF